jgi:hypothetical protein
MLIITLPAEAAKSLTDFNERAILCDDSGRELGIFEPLKKTSINSPLSIAEIEELRSRYQPGTGKTTEEVLKKWVL